MAYVPVPKDLTQVKTKLVLNLTKRQLIFFQSGSGGGSSILFSDQKRVRLQHCSNFDGNSDAAFLFYGYV